MAALKKNSLATKIFLSYISLVILPFLFSTLILSFTSSSNIESNTLSYINLFVGQLSSNVDNYVSEMDRMTNVLTLNSDLCGILTESPTDDTVNKYHQTQYLENEILKLMTQQPSIRNVSFIGTNGLIYSGPSNRISNRELFFQITDSDPAYDLSWDFQISPAHIPSYLLVDFAQNKEPVFTLTRFLYTKEHKPVGSIVLTVTCQDLLDAVNINPALLESGARIVLTNKEDQIVADTSSDFIPDNLNDPSYIGFNPSKITDKDTLSFSNNTGAINSAVIINKSQLFKSTQDFNRAAVILVAFLIGIISFLSFYFSRKLVKPLLLLRNAANEFASGNYTVRIPIDSHDEIGDLCSSFNFMAEQTQDLLDRVYQHQLATKQAQLEALQNQISPHFLHNTLEIIRMKALINKDSEVAVMVQTLARLFRITLDRTNNIVTIKDELDHAETYLTIQNMRFNNRYKFIRLVPEEYLDCSIIKLTLQPLVENAIKHGFSHTFGDEEIRIQVQADGDDLIIQVADNGVGIEPDNLERIHKNLRHMDSQKSAAGHNSIGIINIADRIRLEYGEKYALKIYPNTPRGTIVELRIPQNHNLESISDANTK